MSGTLAQFGTKDEVTWNTAVTVDRFQEITGESVSTEPERVESESLRANTWFAGEANWMPGTRGSSGEVTLEVMTKGFGIWLKRIFGAVATTGPTDSKYTHTGTVASMVGTSFTGQIGRPASPSLTVHPFTFTGGKVTNWSFSNSVNGLLMCTLGMDYAQETTATALATASYPSGRLPFSFAGGAITVGGTAFEVITDVTISGNNNPKTDRYTIGSVYKKEQVGQRREAGFEFNVDFENLTNYNRFMSLTNAGAHAQVVCTWTGNELIGASAYPTFSITIPVARFDGGTPNVSGPDILTQTLTGSVRNPSAGGSPITAVYGSADATP